MDRALLLTLLIPPAAGAVIGYITNKIAITMLFRPYREKRFLGLKIPFTPGIIPRQRYELSQSIARQVARELFTVEAVSAQMETEGFRSGLETAIRRAGDYYSGIELAQAAGRFTSPSEGDSSRGAATEELSLVVQNIVSSPGVHRLVTALLRAFSRAFLGAGTDGSPAGSTFGPAGEITAGILRRQLAQGRSLNDVMTPDVRRALIAALGGVLPSLREFLIEWLNRPSTRDELHRRGILLMRDAVNSLSSLQRLVVIAGQYDRTMEEKMSFLVDRFVLGLEESIQDPATVEGLMQTADQYLRKNASRPLDELLSPGRVDELAGVMDRLFEGIDPLKNVDDFSLEKVLKLLPEDVTIGELVQWNGGGGDILVPLLRKTVTGLLIKAVPAALEVMDIEKLVVNRIDSLAIEQVESLLLAVIKKHLKWINIFGALLGALIGGIQILLMFLRN